ncbi:MAG: glycosyltransferase family 1 protein [Acidithiobacillus sp.]|nr:glycosyltransferase family 1 protein [Acidithiobacillus sp.]
MSEQPLSLARYAESVLRQFSDKSITIIPYQGSSILETPVDLLWDPYCGWSQGPVWPAQITSSHANKIITFHGAAPWSMDPIAFWGNLPDALRHEREVQQRLIHWLRQFLEIDKVIVPSRFAAVELAQYAGANPRDITVIHHGVDAARFHPPSSDHYRSGILHISSWQPKKNVHRVIEVARESPLIRGESLTMLVPNFPSSATNPDITGLHIERQAEDDNGLCARYQGAKVFLFPSLHETFGMPILEAMACGCPVIAGRNSAMEEIFADSALLVDPYSLEDIIDATEQVLINPSLWEKLHEQGLKLAQELTWERSANAHLQVFRETVTTGKPTL